MHGVSRSGPRYCTRCHHGATTHKLAAMNCDAFNMCALFDTCCCECKQLCRWWVALRPQSHYQCVHWFEARQATYEESMQAFSYCVLIQTSIHKSHTLRCWCKLSLDTCWCKSVCTLALHRGTTSNTLVCQRRNQCRIARNVVWRWLECCTTLVSSKLHLHINKISCLIWERYVDLIVHVAQLPSSRSSRSMTSAFSQVCVCVERMITTCSCMQWPRTYHWLTYHM